MSNANGDGSPPRLENPRFWEQLQETFETAVDVLEEIADAQGIDVTVPGDEVVRKEEARLDERARGHELVQQAAEYAEEVDLWFRRAKAAVREWGREAAQVAEEKGDISSVLEGEADELQEAIESIADARYRIGVKLTRAVRFSLREDSTILSPMDGAAEKAAAEAYVLAEDSIRHWMRLREILPGEEDDILHLLVNLGRIREGMMAEFGGALPERDAGAVEP